MGKLSERITALRERSATTETVEIPGLGLVGLRTPSWRETVGLDGSDAPAGVNPLVYASFRGTVVTVRDPETGEPLFAPDAEGYEQFASLPAAIARALIAAANRFLERQEGFVTTDPETKKKSSPRPRKRRT